MAETARHSIINSYGRLHIARPLLPHGVDRVAYTVTGGASRRVGGAPSVKRAPPPGTSAPPPKPFLNKICETCDPPHSRLGRRSDRVSAPGGCIRHPKEDA